MDEKRPLRQRLLESSSKTKAILGVFFIALCIVGIYSYQARTAVKTTRTGDVKPAVDILTVQRRDLVRSIDLTGQTVPESQVDIAAKYSGKIIQVNVNLGDVVAPGQILLVQDTGDVDAALAQNNASLRQADADAIESSASFEASYQKAKADYQHSVTNYERYNTLYAQGAISHEALDNAEQQMNAAKAAVDAWSKQLMSGSAASVESKRAARDKAQGAIEALQNQRGDLVIRAPRAGIIGYRQAEVGNMAQPAQKLLSIVDSSKIYVDCPVSEQDIGPIVIGMPTNVMIESLGKSYIGKIIYVSPSMDAKTQNFSIRIALDQPDNWIKIGMFARTNISFVLRPQTLFVPKEAILSLNGKDRVFVVDANNQVSERTVQLGLRNDASVEILSGIREGDQVAISNISRLKNGLTITPNTVSK